MAVLRYQFNVRGRSCCKQCHLPRENGPPKCGTTSNARPTNRLDKLWLCRSGDANVARSTPHARKIFFGEKILDRLIEKYYTSTNISDKRLGTRRNQLDCGTKAIGCR